MTCVLLGHFTTHRCVWGGLYVRDRHRPLLVWISFGTLTLPLVVAASNLGVYPPTPVYS